MSHLPTSCSSCEFHVPGVVAVCMQLHSRPYTCMQTDRHTCKHARRMVYPNRWAQHIQASRSPFEKRIHRHIGDLPRARTAKGEEGERVIVVSRFRPLLTLTPPHVWHEGGRTLGGDVSWGGHQLAQRLLEVEGLTDYHKELLARWQQQPQEWIPRPHHWQGVMKGVVKRILCASAVSLDTQFWRLGSMPDNSLYRRRLVEPSDVKSFWWVMHFVRKRIAR